MHLGKIGASVALAVAASTASVPAANAGSWYTDTHKPCNWRTYKDHYSVAVTAQHPVITHVETFGMPPSARHQVTKMVAHSTTLSASATYSESATVEANEVFAKASATVGFGLALKGSHTATSSTKVTDTISNNTGKNAAFVFYAGDTQVKGTFRYHFCEQTHAYSAWTIRYTDGHWKSYGVHGSGAAMCHRSGVTALQKLALSIGCR